MLLFTPGSSIVDFFISPASHFDLIDKIVIFFRAPDEVTMPCHESLCKIYVKNQEEGFISRSRIKRKTNHSIIKLSFNQLSNMPFLRLSQILTYFLDILNSTFTFITFVQSVELSASFKVVPI